MFPPGNAAPADAIAAHLRYRSAWFAALVGPLLVHHHARWDEFVQAHAEAGSPVLQVGIIGAATPPAHVPAGMRITGFELPVSELPLPDPGRAFQLACEVTTAADRAKILTGISERRRDGQRVIAKFRTGGTSADAFPSEHDVAAVIVDAARVAVPLKFTAGLHHAVRFTDASTGLEQHGFLNLLIAVARSCQGADPTSVLAAVAERDTETVASEVRSWSPPDAGRVREAFVSFGCCGLEEPVSDLVRLGLLDGNGR